MRALPVVAAGLSIGLTATVEAMTALASGRQASFAHAAAALEHRWDADTAAGEPAASLEPLRSQLARSAYDSAPGRFALDVVQSVDDDDRSHAFVPKPVPEYRQLALEPRG
jgi:hypothetical protein